MLIPGRGLSPVCEPSESDAVLPCPAGRCCSRPTCWPSTPRTCWTWSTPSGSAAAPAPAPAPPSSRWAPAAELRPRPRPRRRRQRLLVSGSLARLAATFPAAAGRPRPRPRHQQSAPSQIIPYRAGTAAASAAAVPAAI